VTSPDALVLTAVRRLPVHEESRGLVRVAAQVLTALGIGALDVVRLEGARPTGALAAVAPSGTPADLLLCDELLLLNLGVADGTPVRVQAGAIVTAETVWVSGPPPVVAVVDPALLRSALHGKVLTAGDAVSLLVQDLPEVAPADRAQARQSLRNRLSFQAGTVRLSVLDVAPPTSALVGAGTQVLWARRGATTGPRPAAVAAPAPPPVAVERPALRLADLPGLEDQAHRLREWLDLAFSSPDLLARLGSAPQTGVLLTGPAGSGRASLVEAVAGELGLGLVRAWGPELAALGPDAAAERLRALLAGPPPGAPPVVVLVEDVEALAPREGSPPLLPTLLGLVRAAVAGGRTAVVCTTTRPEAVAPALTAPGLLEHQLAVLLPDRAQRRRLLGALTAALPLAPDVALDDVAARTPGFVAADLVALLRTAGSRAAARQRDAPEPRLAARDLDDALEVVRPSAAEGTLELGGLTLDEVGDMVEVKAALTEAVLWPLRYPDTFASLGVTPARGVLLYGPPGCGKTFLVRALAGSGEANVLSVKGAELLSKWVGESEAAVRELFRRAREQAPSLVFLDEVDALAPVRGGGTDGGTTDRVVAALLTELDGVEQRGDVVVIGATNRPDRIDPALLRPGRLERLVFVPPPDAAARTEILRAAARRVPLQTVDATPEEQRGGVGVPPTYRGHPDWPQPPVDLVALGRRTEGYSAADCAALVREAALAAMRESRTASTVTAAHLEAALAVVRPSLDPAQVAELAAYAERRER
jgi:transitional endoplasmic reticulum ATPase